MGGDKELTDDEARAQSEREEVFGLEPEKTVAAREVPDQTLADGLLFQLARVRELQGLYRSLGPTGTFGLIMMEELIKRTERAMLQGDVLAMLRCYHELKGCK